MPTMTVRAARAALAALVLAAPAGCGYSVRPPYDANIKTVYVPIFQSVSFRRNLNLELTELVMKEIEKRTPYKVVGSPEGADATLEGIINLADKNLMVENPNNLPRQLSVMLLVSVKFVDNRAGVEKKDVQPAIFVELVPLYPELGETTSSAFQKGMAKLARDIVNTMEQPWDVKGPR